MPRITASPLVLASTLALVAGCASPDARHDHSKPGEGSKPGMMEHMAGMKGRVAVASLTPTQGQSVQGLVTFHQMGDHVMVHARVSGLKPGAEHGFHVHEKGDCASVDGTSAGGHFNPDGKPHGPQSAAHHAGDMPALKADANGVAEQKFMLMGPTVGAGAASVVGRALIVHAGPDDYATQPTGNSGARIGCGVIAGY